MNHEPFIYERLDEKLLHMAYLYLRFIIQFQLPYISDVASGACEGSLACSTCHVIVMVCSWLLQEFIYIYILLDWAIFK